MKTENVFGIVLGLIVFCILLMVILLVLSKLGIEINKICNEQFKDCIKNNGTLNFIECSCYPSLFSDDDCKQCYESSGQWCYYPNGTGIKCVVNST